jgi:hypothetical protein
MEIVLFSYGFSEEKGYQVKSEDRRGILEMGCLKIDIVTIRRLAATMSHNRVSFSPHRRSPSGEGTNQVQVQIYPSNISRELGRVYRKAP